MSLPAAPSGGNSAHISSLLTSFASVPAAAAPAIIDCVLASSALSPSQLFSTLLEAFPKTTEAIESKYILSHYSALCHLIKKIGTRDDSFLLFTWRVFLPLVEDINTRDVELLNQIIALFCDIVSDMQYWELIVSRLVPFCLRCIGLCAGMIRSEVYAAYQWSSDDFVDDTVEILPFPLACRIMTSLLHAALRCRRENQSFEQNLVQEHNYFDSFAHNLTWDLSKLVLGVLMQSSEHRSFAVRLLLPVVVNSLNELSLVTVFVNGSQYSLSRIHLLKDLWNCCIPLFSLGHPERLVAYSALASYFSAFSHAEGSETASRNKSAVQFDILTSKEFWEAIQNGLVDKDGSIRKQALHILKTLLSLYLLPDGKCDYSANTVENCQTGLNGVPSHVSATKRERWAHEEAKSLGVGEVCHLGECSLKSHERWKIFVFLYEMLEEYGQHLVEAAWSHLVSLLFQPRSRSSLNSVTNGFLVQMENMETIMSWLTILWERGFSHGNPQVRCLIMDSFLCMDWEEHGHCAQLVPRNFILGSFTRALNDVVHHKDFGVKGVYSSKTIERSAKYFGEVAREMTLSDKLVLVWSIACLAKADSFGRAGLMALACCIASAAASFHTHNGTEVHNSVVCSPERKHLDLAQETSLPCCTADLLDALGDVIERSKQHFNPNYRLKVCEQAIKAALALIRIDDVELNLLLHFISTVPREFTDFAGPLREMVQQWLTQSAATCSAKLHILKNLTRFPLKFFRNKQSSEALISYDDDDVDAWVAEAQRWARMLLLVVTEEQQLEPIFTFFQEYSSFLCEQDLSMHWIPIKLLILIFAMVEEFHTGWWRITCLNRSGAPYEAKQFIDCGTSSLASVYGMSKRLFLPLLEKLISFAKLVSSVFWSIPSVTDTQLPLSITGKLGGPSQRRLDSFSTSAVLNAILSIRTVASISSWCNELLRDKSSNSSFDFLWNFSWKAIRLPIANSESEAEIHLAAYEALASVFKAFSTSSTDICLNFSMAYREPSMQNEEPMRLFDSLALSFLQNINNLIGNGPLTRSRRAVLMNWKWICLDSLLSIPYANCECLRSSYSYFSPPTLRLVAFDIIESLENAGENSMLPMLRSIRLVFGLLFSDKASQLMFSSDGVANQMMSQLAEASWILHVSCNKRRVAPIAALLSAVLHQSVFGNLSMHETDGCRPGPLKLFIERLVEDGQKSPRTVRLAALHLTGLWLLYPRTIKYYMKELKLLSLYGSVAFDEDFEAELSENHAARIEVPLLSQSPDHEFTEVFINTEMYARASVAALFHKLASFGNKRVELEKQDLVAAFESGKMFLLELLDSVVNDNDLSKELYKKYSGVHRRKVRAWQMICILSHFVEEDIVEKVTSNLHVCLYRSNLPAVRQYLEIFAIQIYLKFPSLAEEQLIPIFRNYNMRPQALSSYVFITANVIIHENELNVRMKHLYELLPPITPLLTSHHHSLRGFTQLLVFHVLCKLWPVAEPNDSGVASLEEKCFNDLKSYLTENTDCLRLRSSMEGFLDAFDPSISATPVGVFNIHKEGSEFECVPMSLMDQLTDFLNDVREDLRYSIAKDAMTIKNENMRIPDTCQDNGEKPDCNLSHTGRDYLVTPKDVSLDFQKKITLNKYLEPLSNADSQSIIDNAEIPRLLSEIEKEDQLFSSVLQARNQAVEKIRQTQQQFILVASLIDRIPNLAGLVRTCEVFKAAGLAIADASILQDKQFQLISVTADKWVPIIEVPVNNVKVFLEKKRKEGFSILGLEQTANSSPLDQFSFPRKTVMVLGREKEGIPADIIHVLDACVEIPQLGIIRSLNVHVSGAIALWEYTRQQRCKLS